MLDNCIDLSNLINPIIDLEDLGRELKPSQLAEVFFYCINNYSDTVDFMNCLDKNDLMWIQDAIRDLVEDETL